MDNARESSISSVSYSKNVSISFSAPRFLVSVSASFLTWRTRTVIPRRDVIKHIPALRTIRQAYLEGRAGESLVKRMSLKIVAL